MVKNPPVCEGDMDSISGMRSPGGGNGNSFQCSFLRNPMDREACWATVEVARVGHDLVMWQTRICMRDPIDS